MKTRFMLLAIACLLLSDATQVLAQKKSPRLFKPGETDLFMQIGILPTYLMDRAKIVLPPMGLRAEHRFGRNYSLGLEGAYSVSQKSSFYKIENKVREYENSTYFIGVRNTLHCDCQQLDNIDLYGGFILGYNRTEIEILNGEFGPIEKHRNILPASSTITYSGFVGLRYACGPWLSLSGEIGFGVSLVQLGVGIKI